MNRRKNKLAIYIDNSNLINILKQNTGNLEEKGKKINYGKLCNAIYMSLKPVYLEKVVLYDGIVINDEKKKTKKENFIKAIERKIKTYFPSVRFESRLFPVELGKQFHIKGDDIALATDLTYDLSKEVIDIAIIVSGDGDFLYLKEKFGDRVRFVYIDNLYKGFSKKIKETQGLITIKLSSIMLE